MIWSFDSIKQKLDEKLALMPKWNKVTYWSVYERIRDVIAYCMEKLAYTADVLYNMSSFLKTSSLKALNIMAKPFSYTAHRKRGATGILLLSKDSDFDEFYIYGGKNVYIPKYTVFTNSGGDTNTYSYEEKTYYSGTEGNLQIPIKEGTPKTFVYTATGIPNEEIKIYSPNIDNDIFDVYIVDANDEILFEVSVVKNLYFINDLNDYYCTSESFEDFQGVTFTFGDGISTKQLNPNDRVMIKYAETQGSDGNIESLNVITVIKDTLYDNTGAVATLYVTNDEAISDGSDYEEIESIRNNAPRLFFAGYRCGTATDWKTIIESFSFIYKAKVWTVDDIGGSTLLSEQNKVFATAITSTGDNLTMSQKTYLEQEIYNNYKSPTEILQFTETQKVYIKFDTTGKIKNNTTSIVQEQLKQLLYDNYATLNTDYQTNIYSSNYINLIDDLDDIVYHETEVKIMDYNTNAVQVSRSMGVFFNDTSIQDDKILPVLSSFEIWIKRKIGGTWQEPEKVASSNTTSFVAESGWTISSSNINYSEGIYAYIIQEIVDDIGGLIYGVKNPDENTDLGYILCVAYNTEDGNGLQQQNIRLPYRYQITDIDEDFVKATLNN